ncbi:MAG: LysR family transcriptional regulator [Polyangiaceae bacterium]|nr:LysR family transcriptional regulator [Polyangiaceae bacterium]
MFWGDLLPLLEVSRTGSLGAAARKLAVSTTTVGRRIAALEAELGLRLIDRQTDGAQLTPHGARIVELASEVEERANALDRLAAALRDDTTPSVRVSSTETVVTGVLAPAVARFLQHNPAIRLVLRAQPEVVSVARRDADIAVRLTRPEGDSLIVKRLAPVELGLYASRQYLGRKRPEDVVLSEERLLGLDDSFGRIIEVAWFEEAGLASAVVFRTSSTQGLLAAARAGAGIALLPRVLAQTDSALMALPAGNTKFPVRTAWLVTHRDLRKSAPIRAVSKWIEEAFANIASS